MGSIKGVVTDDRGIPLHAASVRIVGTRPLRGIVVAPDGSYSIQGLRPGVYGVLVTMVGRRPVSLPELRVRTGRDIDARFTLTFAPISYDTIVVRSTRSVRPEMWPDHHGSLDPLGRAGDEASVLPGPRSTRGGERP
jgi:hypothetical protein